MDRLSKDGGFRSRHQRGFGSLDALYGAPNGDLKNAALKRQITGNMIDLLLYVQADFDGDEQLTPADIDLLFLLAGL